MAYHVKDIIAGLLHQQNDWQVYLLQNWHTIVGNLHTRIRLEKIEHQLLIVGVYDSHWMHEMHMLAQPLIAQINSALEKPYIHKVRFKLIQPENRTPKITKMQPIVSKQYSLSLREQTVIARFKDNEMQNALKNFLIRCKQYD